MPKYAKFIGYYLFFWSNEGKPLEPLHIHVGKEVHKNATKIWILSDGSTQIESNSENINAKDLRRICRLIEEHAKDIVKMWEEYFQVNATYKDQI